MSVVAPGREPMRRLAVTGQRDQCGARVTSPCEVSGRFRSISAGFLHTCGIGTDGVAYCWGDGRSGAVGDGKLGIRRRPSRVAGGLRFIEMAGGGNYTCGRSADSSIYCWGKSQPVPNYPRVSAAPAQVALPVRAIALTAGRRHACVLDAGGSALCWGFNVDGETGNGTRGIDASVTTVPTPVAGELRFSAVSAGFDFTCALTMDGAPYCWGSNVDQVLGAAAPDRCGDVAPIPCASRPVAIETSLRFVEISAGGGHVCARTTNGEIYCWGANGQGQGGSLGPQHAGPIFPPRRVMLPGFDPVTTTSSGATHTCGLASSGALFCWGSDAAAQLGVARNLDVQFEPLRSQWRLEFRAVSAGGYHTCGLTAAGVVYCWGDDQYGALGN